MNAIIFFVLVLTGVQFFVCHISLWWIAAVICRLCFMSRIMGITFKVKRLAIAEGVIFGCRVLYNMVMHGDSIPWLNLGLNLLFILLVIGLEFLDDLLYVYLIEDADEDD